jgi:hypothetical protein
MSETEQLAAPRFIFQGAGCKEERRGESKSTPLRSDDAADDPWERNPQGTPRASLTLETELIYSNPGLWPGVPPESCVRSLAESGTYPFECQKAAASRRYY